MLRLHKKKAQSTVEYVLLVTAVIVVILVVTRGPVTNKLTSTLTNTTQKIESKVTDLDASQKGTAPPDTTAADARVKQHVTVENPVDLTKPDTWKTIP